MDGHITLVCHGLHCLRGIAGSLHRAGQQRRGQQSGGASARPAGAYSVQGKGECGVHTGFLSFKCEGSLVMGMDTIVKSPA